MQDKNAGDLNSAAAAQRAATKCSTIYNCASWDLVDAAKEPKFDIATIKVEQLPENMKKMTAEQRTAHVKKMGEKRTKVQKQIADLSKKREGMGPRGDEAQGSRPRRSRSTSRYGRRSAHKPRPRASSWRATRAKLFAADRSKHATSPDSRSRRRSRDSSRARRRARVRRLRDRGERRRTRGPRASTRARARPGDSRRNPSEYVGIRRAGRNPPLPPDAAGHLGDRQGGRVGSGVRPAERGGRLRGEAVQRQGTARARRSGAASLSGAADRRADRGPRRPTH